MTKKYVTCYIENGDAIIEFDDVFTSLDNAVKSLTERFIEIQIDCLFDLILDEYSDNPQEAILQAEKLGIITSSISFTLTLGTNPKFSSELAHKLVKNCGNFAGVEERLRKKEKVLGFFEDYAVISTLEY